MLKNYLGVALRRLLGNKLFSFINLFGLAVGLASAILIGLYVADELSYDRFHPDAERRYLVLVAGAFVRPAHPDADPILGAAEPSVRSCSVARSSSSSPRPSVPFRNAASSFAVKQRSTARSSSPAVRRRTARRSER